MQPSRASEGPLLALAFVLFLAATGLVIWGVMKGPQPIDNACQMIIGAALIGGSRAFVELIPDTPMGRVVRWFNRLILVLGGLMLIGDAVYDIAVGQAGNP